MAINDGYYWCLLMMMTAWWFGTWMDYDFPYIGNFIIPTVTQSIVFQRGLNHQMSGAPKRWQEQELLVELLVESPNPNGFLLGLLWPPHPAGSQKKQATLSRRIFLMVPSGKHRKNDGKSSCLMDKSSISMAIFNSKLLVITRG